MLNVHGHRNFFGMQVVITTTATTDEEGKALLTEMGVPFKRLKKDVKDAKQEAKKKPETTQTSDFEPTPNPES